MTQRPEEHTDNGGKISGPRLELLVREMGPLPTFACVIVRAADALRRDPRAGVREAVGADVSLTANLLRLAAGRRYGPASTAQEVLERAPAEVVCSAVLRTPVFDVDADGCGAGSGLDLKGLWRHSLAVGHLARAVAEKTLLADPGTAFTCGLLHDVGKLVLSQRVPKSYARVLEAVAVHQGDFSEYERYILGVDHSTVGRRLAEHWHLPRAVQDTIWLCHHPSESVPSSVEHGPLIAVLSLADALAYEQGYTDGPVGALLRTSQQLAAGLRVPDKVVAECVDLAREQVSRDLGALGLDLPCAPEVCREAAGVCAAELGRLNERLQQNLQQSSAKAAAFDHFRRFQEQTSSEMTLGGVLAGIVDTMARAAAAEQPVVAYALSPADGEALVVRRDAAGGHQWQSRPAPEALLAGGGQDVAAVEELADTLDVGPCTHRPLMAGGQWVGGVFLPVEGPGGHFAVEVTEALAGPLAETLLLARSRSQAIRLSEELAGTGQAMAAAQEALAEARTLAAVGEMAAGAAHELNNPLAVVSGRAQLMRDRAATEAERQTWDLIVEQSQRISDVITELMDFARPAEPQRAPVSVRDLLDGAVEKASSSGSIQAGAVRVDIDIGEGVADVMADREQIEEVLAELISNAAVAMKADTSHPGRIHLSAGPDDASQAVLIAVEDEGSGMDEATVQRVFTPFFSLQEAGRRRGLGLPRAKRYVENGGGRMWIRSGKGVGTTVYVQLPRA